jgi:hypothetical protein
MNNQNGIWWSLPAGNSMNRVWRLKVRPSFREFPSRDPPDHNPAELDFLAGLPIASPPRVADYDLVSLGNDVINGDVNIGKPLESCREILLGAFRTGRQSRWDIGSMLAIIRREISVGGREVLPVNEIFKMPANERFRFSGIHFLPIVAQSVIESNDEYRAVSAKVTLWHSWQKLLPNCHCEC